MLADYASTAFSWAQNVRWSRRLLRVHLNSDYEAFLGRHSADIGYGLLGRVQEVVSGSLLPGLRLIVNVLVVLCICGVLLRTLPPMVLLGVAGIAILYCGIFLGLRKRLSSLGKEREVISATRFRLVSEISGGIKEIKLHGLEAAYDERTRMPFKRHAALQSQRHLLSILPRYLFEAIGFIGLCLVVLMLGASDSGMGSVLLMLGMVGFAAFRLLPALQQVYQNAVPLPIGLPALNTLHAELTAGQEALLGEPVPLQLSQCAAAERGRRGPAHRRAHHGGAGGNKRRRQIHPGRPHHRPAGAHPRPPGHRWRGAGCRGATGMARQLRL